MAKEKEIVAQINTDLQAGQFSSKRFQKGRFSGIAELLTKPDVDQRQTIPTLVENNGTTDILSIDDKYPFQLYHRHIGSSVNDIDVSEQFGDRIVRQETAQMLIVIVGDRKRLNLTQEEIITGIMLGIPLELGSTFLNTNSLDSANIIPGDWSLIKEDVWNAEYNSSDVKLTPQMIFISLAYAIETRARAGCINVCD